MNNNKGDLLTPDMINLIWNIPCLVNDCDTPYEHWTIEHECQSCKELGHSSFECNDQSELKILSMLTELQFNPAKKEVMLASISKQELKKKLSSDTPKNIPKNTSKNTSKKNKIKFPFRRKKYVMI